ncbi:MAG: hypothetical protein WA775_15715 [Psychroserpens sp.]|uniref:hypothetical protein n=1 Tax=Psychroserpens sp. TaxID=2020870 RepID=UPI003C7191FD
MKNTLSIAIIVLFILAVAITYLGLQRDSLFNPPVITGLGFFMIAIVFVKWRKQM